MEGRSLLSLDIGLPVEKLAGPVRSFLNQDPEEVEQVFELNALNRRGRAIVVRMSNTLRRGPDGQIEGVVLMIDRVGEQGG